MAGEAEVTDPQAVATDELKASEDEGSLADIVAKTQHPVFSGHPAMGEEEGGEADPEGGGETDPPEGGDKSLETKASPEGEIPEGWGFKPKYKDHKEAEKGAKEHQALATRATQDAAREKEAREAAEQERDEIKQKLAEKETAAPEKVAEKVAEATKTQEELEAAQEAKIEQALNEIDQIDEFDPDYRKKVAKAWRKVGLGGTGQPAIPDPKVLEELVSRQVEERFKAEKEAKVVAAQQTEKETVRTKAGELAGKNGLNMEEGSADHILFWATADKMPKEFDDKSFEEQVQWTVNEVRRLKGEVVQSKAEMDAKARETQINNAVLGRGADRPKKPTPPEPYTLGSIMNKHQASRRI